MSMIQQIHYATCWRSVKVAQYDKAIQSQTIKGAGLQGAAGEADIVLYNIRKGDSLIFMTIADIS